MRRLQPGSARLGNLVLLVLVACASERSPSSSSSDATGGAADAESFDAGAQADAGAAPVDGHFGDAALADDAAVRAESDGGSVLDAGIPAIPDTGGSAGADAAVSGCGKAMPAGFQAVDTLVAGVSRHYQVFVPNSYDPSVATRLIFVFHGLGGDGDQIRSYLNLEAEAAGGAIFAYPDGRVVQGGRTGWELSDLAFFDAMLSELSASYCIDPQRVFAMGHSMGAYMTNEVGCQRGSKIRAIAAVSGGTLGSRCQRPVAAWLAHGGSDTVVPESQGEAARDHWLAAGGCSSVSAPTTPEPCVAYAGCAAGGEVTWCPFPGGHYPPFPAFVEPAIWEFFRSR